MRSKRIIIMIFALIIVVGALLFWDNMLIWDDFSCSYKDKQTYSEDNSPPQPPEGLDSAVPSPAPSKSESANSSEIPIKKGYHIHINLDEHKLYVFKDGQLLKTYPVSGGKGSTPTPVGNWKISGKDTWGEGFGGAWMAINVPWGKYGIHGTVYPWVIGKSNASKGCIRMLNKDARELYKMVPVGTTVSIVQNNPVFRIMRSGAIGSDVQRVQSALNKLGYYKTSADGRFGTGLKAAVIKFQKANKLKQTGTIDRRTFDLILLKVKEFEANTQ